MQIDYQIKTTDIKHDLQSLSAELFDYNVKQLGSEYHTKELLITAKHDNNLIAGLYGWLRFGWLYIDRLWVSDKCRNQGIGKSLMQQAEQFAMQNNIKRVQLQTGSFQEGLSFYQKLNYQILCEWPATHNKQEYIVYLLQKELLS